MEFKFDLFIQQQLCKIMSYVLSKSVSIGSFYLHGKGKNNDFEANFLSFNTNILLSSLNYMDLT